ncbi:hypothetical protein OsJ_25589 [Oryza sativa Japonica Group]|uniref:Uncharacterized protein n=1 Tax=Oryza sativa subsp. japonica TaxID=39947 RepID=A3BNF8_ORYSJ|nr:hypothetical protein OsJ_25589 [Oryza sativa Japonica Group]
MPLLSSWLFHKLRRRRSAARGEPDVVEAASKKQQPPMAAAAAAAPCSPSPNRASYYFASRERCLPPARAATDNHKLRDTRFPRSPQPNDDIVFDVVAVSASPARGQFDGMKAMPELKLRPILTKRATAKNDGDEGDALDSGTSAAASPTSRVRRFVHHAKPSSGRRKGRVAALPADATSRRRRRRRRCRWLYESLVVVKESADPEENFLENHGGDDRRERRALAAGPRGASRLLPRPQRRRAPPRHRRRVPPRVAARRRRHGGAAIT